MTTQPNLSRFIELFGQEKLIELMNGGKKLEEICNENLYSSLIPSYYNCNLVIYQFTINGKIFYNIRNCSNSQRVPTGAKVIPLRLNKSVTCMTNDTFTSVIQDYIYDRDYMQSKLARIYEDNEQYDTITKALKLTGKYVMQGRASTAVNKKLLKNYIEINTVDGVTTYN